MAGDLLKVSDFGLARAYQESALSGLTLQGEMGGTLHYMPPEQISDFRHVTPAADQYSPAATLYYLLTRRNTHDFPSELPKALAMILLESPVPLEKRRPEIPAPLVAAVHRALAHEPPDRFPSVTEFRDALLDAV